MLRAEVSILPPSPATQPSTLAPLLTLELRTPYYSLLLIHSPIQPTHSLTHSDTSHLGVAHVQATVGPPRQELRDTVRIKVERAHGGHLCKRRLVAVCVCSVLNWLVSGLVEWLSARVSE